MLDMSMMADIYIIATAITSFTLGIIWSRRDAFNITLKLLFFGIAAFGTFIAGSSAGYIVQIGSG